MSKSKRTAKSVVVCELCECEAAFNFHHFIPRTVHRNKWFKKRYTREELQTGVQVCRQCHRTIHDLVTEKELGRHYNTRDKLLAHAGMARYITWKQKKLRPRP